MSIPLAQKFHLLWQQPRAEKLLLRHCDVQVNARDERGYSSLHLLCSDGIRPWYAEDDDWDHPLGYEVDIFGMMIDAGADVSARTFRGLIPLRYAAERGMELLIPRLLRHHADSNIQCVNGGTALHHAVKGGHTSTVDMLIQSGMSILDTDKNNRIPLLWAYEGDVAKPDSVLKMVIYLIELGSPFDHLDSKQHNILHIAATCSRPEAVSFLLNVMCMDPNKQDMDGMTPLHLAAERDDSKKPWNKFSNRSQTRLYEINLDIRHLISPTLGTIQMPRSRLGSTCHGEFRLSTVNVRNRRGRSTRSTSKCRAAGRITHGSLGKLQYSLFFGTRGTECSAVSCTASQTHKLAMFRRGCIPTASV